MGLWEKHVLLGFWTALHVCALTALFALDSDVRIALHTDGYKAAGFPAVLFICNLFLFMRLHSFAPTVHNGGEARICSNTAQPTKLKPTLEFSITDRNSSNDLNLDDSVSSVKYCKHCSCWQPLIRCHHCKDCGRCIQGFDHHCIWLGTCVGDSNCLTFWCYLLSQFMLCMYVLHHGFTAIRNTGHVAVGISMASQQLWSICFTAILLLCTLMVGALLGFHTLLLVSNWKTYELIKGPKLSYISRDNIGFTTRSPFDRGPASNIYNLLFNRQLYNTISAAGICYTGSAAHPNLWDNSYYSCC